jgi:hypothetical protein
VSYIEKIIKPKLKQEMKKLTLILMVALFSTSVNSQDKEGGLKPFKVDVSIGYAIPGGSGAKGGILFAVEPKYSVMPRLALGLRMEAAVVARVGGYDASGNAQEADVKASASYVATGDYYLSDKYSFRPFVGAGAGLYQLAAATTNSSGSTASSTEADTKFGGLVRAGFEAGHFRLGLEYNLIPHTTIDGFDSAGNPAKVDVKNGYIGIKIGVVLGGGPR